MNATLSWIAAIAALAVAAWAGLAALRDRPIGRSHLVSAGVVEVALLVVAGAAVAEMINGARPDALGTFLGYLLTTLGLMPTAVVLARMEPTRWGAAILAGAAVVVPVLVLRLHQVWAAAGG